MTRRILGLLVVAFVGGACGGPSDGSPPGGRDLSIFAAASLRSVVDALGTAYEGEDGPTVTVATGSSAALATQIEAGAPADVFLSADLDQPRRLVSLGLADAVVPFASNALAIVVPLDNPQGIRTPADLANHGVRVIAAGEHVPITRYAEQLLTSLAELDGYPDFFLRGYELNVVSREDDVKAVTAKIELGEGDAAIVYATDAASSREVRQIPIPPGANVRAAYGSVAVRTGDRAAGQAFLEWLTGPRGQEILTRFGFLRP